MSNDFEQYKELLLKTSDGFFEYLITDLLNFDSSVHGYFDCKVTTENLIKGAENMKISVSNFPNEFYESNKGFVELVSDLKSCLDLYTHVIKAKENLYCLETMKSYNELNDNKALKEAGNRYNDLYRAMNRKIRHLQRSYFYITDPDQYAELVIKDRRKQIIAKIVPIILLLGYMVLGLILDFYS